MRKNHKSLSGFGYLTATGLPAFKSSYGSVPLSIVIRKNIDLKSLTIYGNTADGIGVGEMPDTSLYSIPVIISGKNMLNYSTIYPASNSVGMVTIAVNGEYLHFENHKESTASYCATPYFTLPPGTYTLSLTDAVQGFSVYFQMSDSDYSKSISSARPSRMIILDSETNIRLLFTISAGLNTSFKLQLENNTESTQFESYITPQEFTVYTNQPVYEGEAVTLFFKSGKAYHSTPSGRIDISDIQTLLSVPILHNGTNIINVNTAVKPNMIVISYRRPISAPATTRIYFHLPLSFLRVLLHMYPPHGIFC